MRSMVEGRAKRVAGAFRAIKGTGKAYRRSKRMRREPTLPEILLWQPLRGRSPLHWRKQHPAGPYSLDFYGDVAKLCVEVDGEAHERGDRPDRDVARDAWLARQGVETLRISAADVLQNLEGVVKLVASHARKRAPLHRPADGPPPPAGPGEE